LQQLELMIAVQSGQAVFSLILAVLLLVFLFQFKHVFLRHWALSCLAMAVHFGVAALITNLVHRPDLQPGLISGLSALALVSAYLHVVWLLLGAWEAVRDRIINLVQQILLMALAIGLGLISALTSLFNPMAELVDRWLPLSILHSITGLAFVIAGVMLLVSLRRIQLISSYLVPLAFGLYGALMLYIGLVSNLLPAQVQFLSPSPVLGLLGFVAQILIGYSIIIWLLEIERRRAVLAYSKAKNAESRLVHFRMHDPATGLPNRRQLQDQLSAEIRAAGSRRSRVAVAVVGIHRFKMLSHALGWQKTDQVIRRLAERLQAQAPAGSMLGRIGEREFLLILPNAGHREKAVDRIQRVVEAGNQPLSQDGQELFINLSGGLSFAPDDDIDAVALINMAQQAQMRAASTGETLILHNIEGTTTEPHKLLNLERELRRGVREKQFCLYFQPLVSIRQRRITGFETLLRWQHPERGLLTPGSFLQEAVRLGVLDELEDQILEQALGQLAEWQNDLSLPPISVSINLSAQRFQQPDLAGKLARLCKYMKVNPRDLHLEITESTAMQDFEAGLSTISALRELGCKVCLDDFGTGYSSLSHLRRLQVDYVKLDRSFIKNLERDPHERDLTRAIVDLIHSLGMTVLAEGVETRQQLGYLIHCRVDVVQGFLLGKPQPAGTVRGALDRPELVLG
jgi:diguanylate cyclase